MVIARQPRLARRVAILSILTTSGVSPDRAELLDREWEADVEARDIPGLERTFWESGCAMRRVWPNRRPS